MIRALLTFQPALTLVMIIGGFACGLLYFASLERSVASLVAGRHALSAIAWTLLRIGAAAGLAFLAAKLGATALLAAFLGFLGARSLALFTARRRG